MKRIPVSRPSLGLAELFAGGKSIAVGQISGLAGRDIPNFESKFADFNGSAHAVACSSGTAALHLSLVALGVGPGDEVLVSDTTNMASFFAVIYTGARPVPVDIMPSSMTMDPADLRKKINSKSKVVMPVHLFGQPCEMSKVADIADEFGLYVVEDCAEAHGASFEGKNVGSFGIAGCFSFFANKILTTGEGGMITTDNPDYAAELRSLRSLNFGLGSNRFLHRGIGFNYRMTNVQAAMGLKQLKKADWLINSRIEIEETYKERLKNRHEVTWPIKTSHFANPVTWMSHLIVPNEETRESLMNELSKSGVETRPGFIPFSLQKKTWARPQAEESNNPVAKELAMRTLYLPTWSGMPLSLVRRISEKVSCALDVQNPRESFEGAN